MTYLKRWIALLTLSVMVTTASPEANAKEYCTDTGGCAYEDAYQSCYVAPTIAFALIAIAAIIAVGVHNRSHSAHAHSSDSSSSSGSN